MGTVLRGTVVHGKGLGRTLGFPTVNLAIGPGVPTGVYQARVTVDGESFRAAAFVGEGLLEAHIFDFDRDVYGHRIDVELVKFIRETKKFNTTEELRTQISRDEFLILNS